VHKCVSASSQFQYVTSSITLRHGDEAGFHEMGESAVCMHFDFRPMHGKHNHQNCEVSIISITCITRSFLPQCSTVHIRPFISSLAIGIVLPAQTTSCRCALFAFSSTVVSLFNSHSGCTTRAISVSPATSRMSLSCATSILRPLCSGPRKVRRMTYAYFSRQYTLQMDFQAQDIELT